MSYPGYPYPGQTGYPGYPPQQQGYPGYTQQPTGYVPPVGYPQTGYPQAGAAPYPGSQPGYPPQQPGYPQTGYPGYPQTGGYVAPTGYPQTGYPQTGAAPYPQTSAYPQAGAYPQTGYPQAGYPPAGYPPQQPQYPPQQPQQVARPPSKTPEQISQESYLSVQTVRDLQAHFTYADRDRSGSLERRELETFWQTAFAKPADQRVLDWTFELFDTKRTGQLTFADFCVGFGTFNRELQLTRQYNISAELYYGLRSSFLRLDRERRGLNAHQLREFLQLGPDYPESQLVEFVRKVDHDGSGTCSFMELIPFIAQLYQTQKPIETAAPVQPPSPAPTVQPTPVAAPAAAPLPEYAGAAATAVSAAAAAPVATHETTPASPMTNVEAPAPYSGAPAHATAPLAAPAPAAPAAEYTPATLPAPAAPARVPSPAPTPAPTPAPAPAAEVAAPASPASSAPATPAAPYSSAGSAAATPVLPGGVVVAAPYSSAGSGAAAAVASPVVEAAERSGWLEKKGTFSWSKFFVRVRMEKIFIYKGTQFHNPESFIPLVDSRRKAAPVSETGATTFMIESDGKHEFRAETDADAREWVAVIRRRQGQIVDEYRRQFGE